MTKANEAGVFEGPQFQKALSAPPEKSGDLDSGMGKPAPKAGDCGGSAGKRPDALGQTILKSHMFSSGHDIEGDYVKLHFRNAKERSAFLDAYIAHIHAERIVL